MICKRRRFCGLIKHGRCYEKVVGDTRMFGIDVDSGEMWDIGENVISNKFFS